jgi:hypothetical protein
MTNNNMAADLVSLYNQHVIYNTNKENQMAHDLLVLNNESNTSETYQAAKKKFQESDLRDYMIDYDDTTDSILDTGFEYGYWAAVEDITGYKAPR